MTEELSNILVNILLIVKFCHLGNHDVDLLLNRWILALLIFVKFEKLLSDKKSSPRWKQ